MDRYIGKCGNCGGRVTVFGGAWGGTQPPVPTCKSCGAMADDNRGPTVPMKPAPKRQGLEWSDIFEIPQ